ncbi:MAG: AraC family transcriptional regulator [Armatimonas sp.]
MRNEGLNHPKLEASYSFNDFCFAELRYSAGFSLPVHTHPQAFLDFCLQGHIHQENGKRTWTQASKTLYFMPIDAPHASRFPTDSRTFQVILPPAWIERVQQVAALPHRLSSFEQSQITWIAERLYREFQRRDALSPLLLEGMLLELFGEMARPASFPSANDCPYWLGQVRDFLHAHFVESLSIEAIALTVGIHPSHLMRTFRQRFHCTIGDYVRKLRIERACQLLSQRDSTVAQVAFSVGFADQSHFTRAFKIVMGMTPAAFQKTVTGASHRPDTQF